MKRIVNGVTYNTATSSRLARFEWENEGHNGSVTETGTDVLYRPVVEPSSCTPRRPSLNGMRMSAHIGSGNGTSLNR